jgi:hypothetical protein
MDPDRELDGMDLDFAGLRRQLAAWRDLEARLGKPIGWAADQHAAHPCPEIDLAQLRVELAGAMGRNPEGRRGIEADIQLLENFLVQLAWPEQRRRYLAVVAECDRLLSEERGPMT